MNLGGRVNIYSGTSRARLGIPVGIYPLSLPTRASVKAFALPVDRVGHSRGAGVGVVSIFGGGRADLAERCAGSGRRHGIRKQT